MGTFPASPEIASASISAAFPAQPSGPTHRVLIVESAAASSPEGPPDCSEADRRCIDETEAPDIEARPDPVPSSEERIAPTRRAGEGAVSLKAANAHRDASKNIEQASLVADTGVKSEELCTGFVAPTQPGAIGNAEVTPIKQPNESQCVPAPASSNPSAISTTDAEPLCRTGSAGEDASELKEEDRAGTVHEYSSTSGGAEEPPASLQTGPTVTSQGQTSISDTVPATAHSLAAASPHLLSGLPADSPAHNVVSHDHSLQVQQRTGDSLNATTMMQEIATAKLVQSAVRSQMSIGMSSADFGQISIRTSTTLNSVTAQISLDHAELAKALSVHLPEMQTKLGGISPADIRIETSSTSGGFGSSSNDRSAQSAYDAQAQPRQTNYQPRTFPRSSHSDERTSEVLPLPVAATLSFGSTRIDIRI